MIPVVIVHFGNQDYFQKVIEITSKKNQIILIGDETNSDIPNIRHIHYKDLVTEDLIQLSNSFYNFLTGEKIVIEPDFTCAHGKKYEFIRFARIFFLRELMKRENIPWVFHIDSDVLLLEDVNDIGFLKQETVTLSKPFLTNDLEMIASIHNALLNLEYCEKIITLMNEFYIDRITKNLLVQKLIWHLTNKIPGNISDSTFHYMVCEKEFMKTNNTMNLFHHKGHLCTFDHCIHRKVGGYQPDMYVMENGIKKLEKDGNHIVATTILDAKVRMLSLHFNADTKNLISDFVKQL